jgi:hypothetical protein
MSEILVKKHNTFEASTVDISTLLAVLASSLTATTVKTSNYTAAIGELVLVDSTLNPITVTAPLGMVANNAFGVHDVAENTTLNVIAINRNGYLINKKAEDAALTRDGEMMVFTYVNPVIGLRLPK